MKKYFIDYDKVTVKAYYKAKYDLWLQRWYTEEMDAYDLGYDNPYTFVDVEPSTKDVLEYMGVPMYTYPVNGKGWTLLWKIYC